MVFINKDCPICGYGQIGFRLCSDKQNILLVCDECGSTWLDPNEINSENVLYPSAPDFKVPGLNCSIKSPESRWAARSEVVQRGWDVHIAGEGPALDEV